MAKGRRRAPGKRTKSGQLSRAGVAKVKRIAMTERQELMTRLYGQNWADPIGRAFEAGLLGEGATAKARLDIARSLHGAYWQAYAVGPYGCALADRQSGGSGTFDADRVRKREEWLRECLSIVQMVGVRPAIDDLVIDVYPDAGPEWLDRLLWAKRKGHEADGRDATRLKAALLGLDKLID